MKREGRRPTLGVTTTRGHELGDLCLGDYTWVLTKGTDQVGTNPSHPGRVVPVKPLSGSPTRLREDTRVYEGLVTVHSLLVHRTRGRDYRDEVGTI